MAGINPMKNKYVICFSSDALTDTAKAAPKNKHKTARKEPAV
jgi:hypothetical protein